ncbi:hypothetical protein FQB35_02590 [Crassaminicella thermophila]|uniref:Uncharacterized protein n=1 Tax=Crassaminicella thermophila TaxID=2599308 RepID=A0A5C0SCB4_CRATE|nr:hypothetical protein [Crassaminicella thermophila]QEK11346.1 hypothetical protein FQB35_02590 [Crassaminicella thermophila]
MDIMPIKVVIFGSIPEASLILWAGLLLMGVKPQTRKIVIAGILQGISVYFIRRYVDFGIHTFVQIIVFIIYTYFIMDVKLIVAILSIIVSSVIVTLIEGSLLIFMDINLAYLWSVDWMRLLLLLPHEIVLGLIIYIGYKKDISLQNEFGWLDKIVS